MSAADGVVRSRPVFTTIPLGRLLAGQRHVSVVYFAQMGFIQSSEVVKIGTSTNLKARMDSLYVPLGNVMAVVPGDREVETAYHRLFAEYQVNHKMREMFRLEGRLKRFLSNQADGSAEHLPPCVPTVMASASRDVGVAEDVSPALVPDPQDQSTPMSLSDIVARGLVSCSVRALRQDRYRSDKGELPAGLVFPEPAAVGGGGRQTELFIPSQVIEFNTARRGHTTATGR